jgi:uncharacterized Zn finger protein
MPRRRNRGGGARPAGEAGPAGETRPTHVTDLPGATAPAGSGRQPVTQGRQGGEGQPAARQGGEGRQRNEGQQRHEGRPKGQRQGGDKRQRAEGRPGRQGGDNRQRPEPSAPEPNPQSNDSRARIEARLLELERQGADIRRRAASRLAENGRPASESRQRPEDRPESRPRGDSRLRPGGASRPGQEGRQGTGANKQRGEGRFRPNSRPGGGEGKGKIEGRARNDSRFRGDSRRRGDSRQAERRPPRLPADGIRAKSQRGEFGESWWARRWLGILEGFGYGTRLTRGRTYARDGAVLSIEVGRGKVSAKVQGSRATPYRVTIGIDPLSDSQWGRAIDAMAEQAIFAAKLLEGEMPQEIEQAFSAAGVPLFPQSPHDLNTSCSCPDYANPCKHIAAVYYLLGERFDEDPFLIFELRGRSKTQVIEGLRERRAAAASGELAAAPAEPIASLADQLARFDEPGADLDPIVPHIVAPKVDSGILRRYGPSPADTSMDIHAIYKMMTRAALERMFGSGSS